MEAGSGRVLLNDGWSGWQLALYPTAFEAGGSFLSRGRPRSGNRGVRGEALDVERSKAEAGRRARGKVRRYCAAHGLNRLGTLTYAGEGCHDPGEVRRDIGVFFRGLRAGLCGAPLPYVWVPELHKSGHGFHAHFAVGRYVKHELIKDTWGHGHVSIKLLGDVPVGEGRRGEVGVPRRTCRSMWRGRSRNRVRFLVSTDTTSPRGSSLRCSESSVRLPASSVG